MGLRDRYKSNVWKYYLFQMFSEPTFVIPVITIFLLARGLSFTQVMMLQAIYASAVFVLEVPTGAVADLIGRKVSLVSSAVAHGAAFAVYAAGHSFLAFTVAEILCALGSSLMSGADSAFIYDSLKSAKEEDKFKKVEGAAYSYRFAFAAVATLLAGFLAEINMTIPFYATVGAYGVSLLVSLGMYEPKHFKRAKITTRRYIKQIKSGINLAARHARIRWLILFSCVITVAGISGFWFYQPYMQQNGLALKWVGVAFFTFNMICFLTSRYAYKIEKKLGELATLALMPLTLILSFVLMATFNPVFGFMFIWLHQIQRGLHNPIIHGYMHEHIESKQRATVMSVRSMAVRLASVPVLPLLGYAVDFWNLTTALWISAGSVIVLATLLFLFRPKVLDS